MGMNVYGDRTPSGRLRLAAAIDTVPATYMGRSRGADNGELDRARNTVVGLGKTQEDRGALSAVFETPEAGYLLGRVDTKKLSPILGRVLEEKHTWPLDKRPTRGEVLDRYLPDTNLPQEVRGDTLLREALEYAVVELVARTRKEEELPRPGCEGHEGAI